MPMVWDKDIDSFLFEMYSVYICGETINISLGLLSFEFMIQNIFAQVYISLMTVNKAKKQSLSR